ncbi:MAG: hypothetical protein ACE5GF_06740 [Thermodesulfobacteriota bacterium]
MIYNAKVDDHYVGESDSMNLTLVLFPAVTAVFFILFSRSKKYYRKTVESYGEAYAGMFFRIMRICGYLLLAGSVGMFLLIIYTL